MHRLATTDNFLAKLRQVVTSSEGFTELRAIAELDLNYVQVIQIDRAVGQLGASQLDGVPHCCLAVLSSSTVDHLLPALTVAGLRYGFLLDSYSTPFDQYRQELSQPDSSLVRFRPDVILCAFSARNFLSSVPISSSASQVEEHLREYLDDLATIWASAKRLSGAAVLQQTFLNLGESLFGSLDRTIPGAPTQVVRRLNDRLIEAAISNGVTVLDLDRPVERDGLKFWFDNAKWLQAKMEISPFAALKYADHVVRIIASQRGLSRKCLVLDLDNTLWGGVIGDDGIENISLGEGSALGEAFVAFQRYIKQLKDRGIILAICSKNEMETAKSVFFDHPEMILKLEDFASFVANWNDKATNLRHIAEELNIGVESLVFVDDNPAERALIRQTLPKVAVPEMPVDPSLYVECLSDAGYFESVSFTKDDLQRSAQYAANAQRKNFASSTLSIDDYLASLNMNMATSMFAEVDLPRITQLINKTNQFNTTTIRRTLEEIRGIASKARHLTLQVRLADRFGDNGLVSAVIMTPCQGTSDTYEIETWVMSCRVFGRQLEVEVLNRLVALAKKENAAFLIARYIPTEKNMPVADLYERLGFRRVQNETPSVAGEMHWKLKLDEFTAAKTHIKSKSK